MGQPLFPITPALPNPAKAGFCPVDKLLCPISPTQPWRLPRQPPLPLVKIHGLPSSNIQDMQMMNNTDAVTGPPRCGCFEKTASMLDACTTLDSIVLYTKYNLALAQYGCAGSGAGHTNFCIVPNWRDQKRGYGQAVRCRDSRRLQSRNEYFHSNPLDRY